MVATPAELRVRALQACAAAAVRAGWQRRRQQQQVEHDELSHGAHKVDGRHSGSHAEESGREARRR